MELHAKYTFFAEGCRGSLGKHLMERFELRNGVEPQTYGIGIKELWEVDPAKHQPGLVVHTAGWPLDSETYGGSFLYHLENNQVAVGFVVGLDYTESLSLALRRVPALQDCIRRSGRRSRAAGASPMARARSMRAASNRLPKLTFPGGVLIGCEAGTLNMPKIKGTHTAMKSGMLAAEAAFAALSEGEHGARRAYRLCRSVRRVLGQGGTAWSRAMCGRPSNGACSSARSIPASTRSCCAAGAVDAEIRPCRHETLDARPADVEADRLSEAGWHGVLRPPVLVFISNTNHEENQPIHLTLARPQDPGRVNLAEYDAPEQRYCPAGVYEIVRDDDGSNPRLQINAQNCVHCKTCDIKDPTQNIVWVMPEGGGGPNYPNM